MQAWLFYDNQDFWKPPQIQVSKFIVPPHPFSLVVLPKKYALHLMLLLLLLML